MLGTPFAWSIQALLTKDWLPVENYFLLAALALMIFFMVMSNKKRKKQADALQTSIAVGATVMLTSGIYGKVIAIDSDKITIESTPGTKLAVNKLAVRSVEAAKAETKAQAPEKKTVTESTTASAAKKPAAKKPAAKKTTK